MNHNSKEDPGLKDLSLFKRYQKKLRDRARIIAKRFLAKIYLKRLEYYPNLQELLSHYATTKSAAIDIPDAIELYEQVINTSPRYLLELGPGTSTAVICLAIKKITEKIKKIKKIIKKIKTIKKITTKLRTLRKLIRTSRKLRKIRRKFNK